MAKFSKVKAFLVPLAAVGMLFVLACGSSTEEPTPPTSHQFPFSIAITDNSAGDHDGIALLWLTFGDGAKSDGFHVKSVLTTTPPTIDGQIDSVWSSAPASDLVLTPQSGTPKLTAAVMKSLRTSTDIYFLLIWTEPSHTKNTDRHRYTYNNGTWTQKDNNEDRVFIMFDINGAADSTGTFAEKGCAVACHVDMKPTKGKADMWHWKASRTYPAGYTDDQWCDPTGRFPDDGTNCFFENGDGQTPAWQDPNDPGADAEFLYKNVSGKPNAVPYSPNGWTNGDQVCAYVYQVPTKSEADVPTGAVYNTATGNWTLEFKRALNTGHADDCVITTQ